MKGCEICLKIDIIGSVASGKTTLARRISQKYGVPYYEKDNIVWERTLDGDKKRTPEERDKEFDKIIKSSDWIVEGSPRDCLRESFDCCDYIIILNEKTVIRLVRVLKRWIYQRMGKERYNSKPTLNFLWCNIKWVFEFNKIKKVLFLELTTYGEKCRIFTHSSDALAFILNIYSEE